MARRNQHVQIMGDGWEPGPNPVVQIIATRTAQVGGAATLALAGAWTALPPAVFWPTVPVGGVAVAGGLSAYFVSVFSARTTWGVPLLMHLPSAPDGTPCAALTFDDGPHPDTTPRLLDLLAQHDTWATFFLVGERARAYPALTRRIVDAGHTIGVHGLRHRTMVLQSARKIEQDLSDGERLFADLTGRPLATRLLRPPYGFKTPTLCRTARRLGWTLAGWSLDPRDYDPHTPDSLTRAVVSRLAPGDIVLLHERPGNTTTADALPHIIGGTARGLRWQALGAESVFAPRP